MRARPCSFGARSAISRRAMPSSSFSVLSPVCGPDFTRFGIAENEVGVRGGGDQPRHVVGVVGEVAVHLQHELRAFGERPAEAGEPSDVRP